MEDVLLLIPAMTLKGGVCMLLRECGAISTILRYNRCILRIWHLSCNVLYIMYFCPCSIKNRYEYTSFKYMPEHVKIRASFNRRQLYGVERGIMCIPVNVAPFLLPFNRCILRICMAPRTYCPIHHVFLPI